jgi:hypothetical protein
MKIIGMLSAVIGSVLLLGTLECHAEKWDKNNVSDATVESGYYNTDSIKDNNGVVSWTEKYILTDGGASSLNTEISKHQKCKQSIAKNGKATQMQLDYQLEKKTLKYRLVAERYYNKANIVLCTSKDTGNDLKSDWSKILRGSPMQRAQYDLVTKYKIKIQ